MDIIEGLVRHQVLFVEKALKRDLAAILSAPVPGPTDGWGHTNYRHPAYTLCYLYGCNHPANPLRGEEWLRQAAVDLIDTWVAARERERASEPRLEETEWPAYVTCRAVEAIGDGLDADRLARWRTYVEDWVAVSLVRPAFFTSPNHELWRFWVLYTAGRTYDRPDWCETAVAMTHQLLHWQAPEGFWEEGVHHGPSMKYNHLSLHPLASLYRATGDEVLGEAARRLAAFMVAYTFPDGTTIGCFDGRQSTSPGYFAPACPGLELAPGGLTLTRRMIDQRRRLGALDDPRALSSSNWYAYFDIAFVTDACRYYEQLDRVCGTGCLSTGARARHGLRATRATRARRIGAAVDVAVEAKDAALPLDADGAVVANHSTTFDGVAGRRGPWVVALSGQESDVPKIGSWVYRLERQSRLSLWHERAGVVLGGGHNLTKQAVPLANAILITGYGPTVEFGHVRGAGEGEARSTYMCRAAETDWKDAAGRLTVHFLHGSVTFEVAPLDGRTAEVRFNWAVRGVERLAVQVPAVVWRGATLAIAGKTVPLKPPATAITTDLAGEVLPVAGPLRVEHVALGFAFEVEPPEVGQRYARYPLWPVRTYGQLAPVEHFDSPYTICLVGTQIDAPPAAGSGVFRLRIDK